MGKTTKKAKSRKKGNNSNTFVYASKEQLTPNYTEQDYIVFIESNIDAPMGTKRKNFSRITKSYWRVTYWGKIDPKNIFSGDKILFSKFIRIDIDSVGRMKYNDVTEKNKL